MRGLPQSQLSPSSPVDARVFELTGSRSPCRLVPLIGIALNGVDIFQTATQWIIGDRAVGQQPARTAFTTKSPAPGVVQNSVQNPLQRYRIQLKSWKLSEPIRSTRYSANCSMQTT